MSKFFRNQSLSHVREPSRVSGSASGAHAHTRRKAEQRTMSGATYAKNIGKDMRPLTTDRYTRDGIAVIEHVLKKLAARKLVLMGASWGSELGLTIANRRPDLIAAYVGTGQAVSGTRGLAIGHDLALEAARKRGDAAAVAALERIGRPPYATFDDFLVHAQSVNQPGPTEMAALMKVAPVLFAPPPPDATYVPHGLPDVDPLKLLMDALRPLWKEESSFEAASLGLEWKIPMYCFQGELDITTPTVLAKEYFDAIKAPANGARPKYAEVRAAPSSRMARR